MMRNNRGATRSGRRLNLEQLEPRVVLAATDLRITEILASNEDGLLDSDGDASDWLEIFNAGSTPVDMAGMYLTDNASDLDKWAFPAGTILPAGGFKVVFASDKNGVRGAGELHTNFKLSADGEYLGLVAADGVTVIDAFAPKFPAQVEDISYGREMTAGATPNTLIANGATARAWVPTSSIYETTWRDRNFLDVVFNRVGPTGFGYENNPGDAVNYTAELGTLVPNTTTSLYMRISFDLTTLTGIDELILRMRYDDGFVAYINGQPVAEANAPDSPQWNSTASGIHDDTLAEQWIEFDVSSAISTLVVGKNVLAIHGLNVPGSDMLIAPELLARSVGISTPEQLGFFDVPTPGHANGEAYLGFADSPTFSVPHGYYTAAQSVAISSPLAGAVIVYTTDGSTPAVNGSLVPINGTLYTGPINVAGTTTLRAMAFKAGYKASFVATSTYLFLNDIVNQSPTGTPPAGWPANAAVNGQQINYGIDPDIIAIYGSQAVKDSLASLPAISITTDLANLFNPTTGIYVNALNDGRSWERPTSVELINTDGSAGFATNAGLRIRGGYSRNDFSPKHAFRLYFRSEYGDGKLEYPLFGDEGTDEFDVIDLRTEQNYSWSAWGSRENTFTREVFARDLQGDLGDPFTRSRYYHLYLNGQYFGIYQTQERVQEDYAATYFGGEPEDYDVVKAGPNDGRGTQVAEGNDLAWQQLFTMAQNLANNPGANINNYWAMQGLNPDGTRNPSLPVLLDVDNLVNYMLIIWYTGGFDTGISRFFGENEANNWYGVYNREAADQGFQFFLHDNEHSLGNEEGGYHGTQYIDRTGPFNAGNQSTYNFFNPVYLHQDLLVHAEYRQKFVEKVQEYFFGDGPMTPAASIARMQERIAQVDPAIIAEAARWGDSKVSTPYNKSTWQTEINWLLNVYFPGRTTTVISQIMADELYVPPPTINPPAGLVTPGTTLSFSSTVGGTVYFSTDGATDPRLRGGGINPAAQPYTGPISLNSSQTIIARLRLPSGAWSPISTASYVVQQPGDYERDDAVNGVDFLAWQRQLGTPASPLGSGADGDRSGMVDAGDLAVWRTNFGVGAEEAIVAAAVYAGSEEGVEAVMWPQSVILDPTTVPAANSQRRIADRGARIDAAIASAAGTSPSDADIGFGYRPTLRNPLKLATVDDAASELGVDALDAALVELL